MGKSFKLISAFLSMMLVFSMLAVIAPAQKAHAAPLRKVVDSSHPLLVLHLKVGPNGSVDDPDFKRDYNYKWSIKRTWASIPDDVKPYVVFVLHPGHSSPITTAESRQWMENNLTEGKDSNIPMMILFGEQPTSGSDGMAWIESLYQNYPNFLGTVVSELTCTISSIPALLALANTYGGYHIHSSQDQDDLVEAKMETSSFYNSVKQYSANFIYAPKTMHNNFQYNNSEALGYWLAGVAGNWGTYWDSFNYGQAVKSPFGQSAISDGMAREMGAPESLWAMNMLDTYMQGATVFCPENTIYPAVNGDLTPVFYNSYLPALRYIIQHPITKATVISNIKVAYSGAAGPMASLKDSEGNRTTFFDGLYASQSDPNSSGSLLFNLRTTGRYYVVPQIPMLAPSSVAAQFPNVLNKTTYNSSFATRNDKLNYFNGIYPQKYTGDAFAQNVGNQWLVNNSRYAANYNANAFIPLTAGANFSEIDFPEMPFGTEAMIDDGSSLNITLNNYMSNHLLDGLYNGGKTGQEYQSAFQEYSYAYNAQDADLRTTTIKVKANAKPTLTLSGYDKRYNYTENWNAATNVFTIIINHNGPINLKLDPAENDTGWTLTDDSSSGITYSGTWTNATGMASNYNSTYSSTTAVGAYADYKFYGSSIEWNGNLGTSGGTADVYVDNVLFAANVSTLNSSTSYGKVIFKKSGLSNSSHTIRIVNKSGTIGVDRFSYIPGQVQMLKDITYNDFSYGTAAEDQGFLSGTDNWTIRNGNMKILPLTGPFNGQVPVYNTKAQYNNFTYTVDVKTSNGDPISVLFRANPATSAYYNLMLDPASVNPNNDGTNKLKLYKDDNILLGSSAVALANNTWYNVKIVANGSTIQCYINGTLYITATDSSYTNGYTGVAVVANSEKGGEIFIDNPTVIVGGSTVYSSDFSSWSTASDWKTGGSILLPNWPIKTSFNYPYQWATTNSTWSVQNNNAWFTSGESGIYSGVGNAAGTGTTLAGSSAWSDFIYTAQLKYKTGTIYDACLAFRATDSTNMYLFSFNGSSNVVRFYKMVNGVTTQLAVANYTITPEKWYSLSVQAVGSFIELGVNGTTLLKAQDSTYTAGKVGFTTYKATNVQFDDAWIAQLNLDNAVKTPVSSIVVSGSGGATTITSNNNTLQMSAAVNPSGASRKDISWSVFEADGITATTKATIDASGVLNALQNGTVKVVAAANDGSKASGSATIVISGQTTNAGIAGIEDVYVYNLKDAVALPSQVKVTYTNGTTGNVNVTWDAVSGTQSATAITPYIDGQTRGKYVVGGTVTGTKLRAYAHVTVLPKITGGITNTVNIAQGTQYAFPLYLDNIVFDAGGGTATFKKRSNILWDSYVNTTTMASGSQVTVLGTIQDHPYQKASVTIHIN